MINKFDDTARKERFCWNI